MNGRKETRMQQRRLEGQWMDRKEWCLGMGVHGCCRHRTHTTNCIIHVPHERLSSVSSVILTLFAVTSQSGRAEEGEMHL